MCDNQEERDYPKGSRASKVADAGLAVLLSPANIKECFTV